MEINLVQLSKILTSSPGKLIYHLVIGSILILIGGLAIPRLNFPKKRKQARHILIGSSILLLIQIILFGASLISGIKPFSFSLLESLTASLTIVWLLWVFHQEDPQFFFTGVNIFLTIALFIIATIIQILAILPEAVVRTDMVIPSWQVGSLILIILGVVLMFKKRPDQWVIAVCILLILAIGHGLQLIFRPSYELNMGAVRLSQILSMPWLIVIVQRFVKTQPEEEDLPEEPQPSPEEKRVDTKPTLISYLLRIPLQETQQEKFKAVVQALSMSVLADICCLVTFSQEEKGLKFAAGYDLIRETYLQTANLSKETLPNILEAWHEHRILKLSQSFTEYLDVKTLTDLINYPRLGNLLALPLFVTPEVLAGGILFLSPYTEKTWDEGTISLLNEIRPTLSKVLFKSPINENLENKLKIAKQNIQQLVNQKESLLVELQKKETALQKLEANLQQWKAKYQVEKLDSVNRLEKMQNQINRLTIQAEKQENSSLKLEQMKANIRQLTKERDQLKSELANAEARIEVLKTEKGQTGAIRLSMNTQVVSLDSIMANVRLNMASALADAFIDLEISNPDGHQMIKTDPELTQTILIGLLDNAIQASNPGGRIQISQELSLETGMLVIQVTDFGEGLTPEEQKSLFGIRPEKSSGIGSIKSLREAIRGIRILNGKIWIKSKKGEHTTFRVQLPVRIID
jgi:signal transduction histidine kinase